MVQRINAVEQDNIKFFSLDVHPGDTIVVEFDQDEWDIHEAQQYIDMLVKGYPKISFLTTFKGIEIKGVIHEDYKCY